MFLFPGQLITIYRKDVTESAIVLHVWEAQGKDEENSKTMLLHSQFGLLDCFFQFNNEKTTINQTAWLCISKENNKKPDTMLVKVNFKE